MGKIKEVSRDRDTKATVVSTLRAALDGMLPRGSAADSEIDAIAQICVMGMIPTGEEDPKEILGSVSDETIAKMASGIKLFGRNPVIGKVAQFFIVEWGLRNGHVEEWRWTWDGPSEGRMSYRPSKSLNELIEMASATKALA
jgi:hypothetical protein